MIPDPMCIPKFISCSLIPNVTPYGGSAGNDAWSRYFLSSEFDCLRSIEYHAESPETNQMKDNRCFPVYLVFSFFLTSTSPRNRPNNGTFIAFVFLNDYYI